MSERADRFTVVLDTNVLVGALTRNMLLSLAEDGLFRTRWSQTTLHQEFERTFKLSASMERRMTARPRTMTLEIDEELREFLTLMVSDAGLYQTVSAYVEDLIRRDRAGQEAAASTLLQTELATGFSAPESTYHPSSAAEVIARNRV